jgi:hypothetical protein
MIDLDPECLSGAKHGIGIGVGHACEEPDFDGSAGRDIPGTALEEWVDQKAVQLLAVALRQVAVQVDEVGYLDVGHPREAQRGRSSRDLSDSRIGVDRSDGHSMSLGHRRDHTEM